MGQSPLLRFSTASTFRGPAGARLMAAGNLLQPRVRKANGPAGQAGPGRREAGGSGDVARSGRALVARHHGTRKVLAVTEGGERDPSDMQRHEEEHEIGKRLVQVLQRLATALVLVPVAVVVGKGRR